jgi:hypothetical protein
MPLRRYKTGAYQVRCDTCGFDGPKFDQGEHPIVNKQAALVNWRRGARAEPNDSGKMEATCETCLKKHKVEVLHIASKLITLITFIPFDNN